MTVNSYEEVKNLKRSIIYAARTAGEGHIASAFSILDVLWVLYNKVAQNYPQNPKWEHRDYVILSKGHGCLALYAVLADRGYFPNDILSTFCKYESPFGGHPHRAKVPGVEASTGSLGHGLPIAVGIAKGLKIRGKLNRVYCIVGDGELNEGTNWEACLLASHHNLDNLSVIVDYNQSGDRALEYRPFLTDKFQAFGFIVSGCQGHDHGTIEHILNLKNVPAMPSCLVLNTVKGKGIREMENCAAWHHRAPNSEEYERFMKELE
jgi:transketolase